jgi:hypothetical protein
MWRIGADTRIYGQCEGKIEGKVSSTYEGASLALRNLLKIGLILTIILFNNREKLYFPKIKIFTKISPVGAEPFHSDRQID